MRVRSLWWAQPQELNKGRGGAWETGLEGPPAWSCNGSRAQLSSTERTENEEAGTNCLPRACFIFTLHPHSSPKASGTSLQFPFFYDMQPQGATQYARIMKYHSPLSMWMLIDVLCSSTTVWSFSQKFGPCKEDSKQLFIVKE